MNKPKTVLLVVAGLVACVLFVGWARFTVRRNKTFAPATASLQQRADADTLARGEHLARTLGGCAKCHGDDFGGQVLGDDAIMRLVAPNLTSGALQGYTVADWVNAVRRGIDRQGHSLLVMPSRELAGFSDGDLAAMIAFLRVVPPVDRVLPPSRVTPLGTLVVGLTNASIFSAESAENTSPLEPPAPGPTRAYGEYLANTCRGCHGSDLRGGVVIQPGAPPSADLSRESMSGWQFAEFERALRTGVGRDGRMLDPAMPWRATRGLTDDEVRALWLGLRQD